MKKLLPVLAFTLLATAAAAAPGPFPSEKTIVCAPPTTVQCVVNPNIAPNPMLPGNNTVCTCVGHPVSTTCQVSIVYPQNDPAAGQMLAVASWCTDAGVRLALSEMLTKLLR